MVRLSHAARAAFALALAALALSACGEREGCDRERGSGVKLEVDEELTREELCAARGRPRRVVKRDGVERWDYGNGVGWDFSGERGRLAVDPEEVDITQPTPGVADRTEGLPSAPPGDDAERGRLLVARAGCMACHRFGTVGNSGPGSDLTLAGDRLSRAQIRRVLRDPPAPMPSYRDIGRRDLDALATYVSGLSSP